MDAQDLKNSILQLAIQGKLVEQCVEEGTAEELYLQIAREKQLLIEKKKAKNDKPFSEITEDEILFEIPFGWKWVRMGEIGIYKKGPFGSALTKSMFVPKGEKTIKVYEQKNAIQKNNELGDYYIKESYFLEKMSGFEVFTDDIIVSCAGTIGETYIMPQGIERGIINQALMRMNIVPQVDTNFFLLYFDYVLKSWALKTSKGSAIKNIPPFDVFKKMVFPLPPIEEQKRIVAKIEELMPYVEKYGEANGKLDILNKNFPRDMKNSILQYAIQGKLVEQRLEEGTASELYEEIQGEKNKLIAEGKIKKEKVLPTITEDEIPFDIPDNWKWVKFGELVNYRIGKTPPRSDAKFWGNDTTWVSIADMVPDGHINNTKEKISAIALRDNFKEVVAPKGTLLMSFKLTIGRVSILDIDAVHNEGIISIFPYGDVDNIIRDYYFKVLPILSAYGNTKGAIKGKTLNSTSISNLLIPLPPMEEQKRIVAKIEEMLDLI